MYLSYRNIYLPLYSSRLDHLFKIFCYFSELFVLVIQKEGKDYKIETISYLSD